MNGVLILLKSECYKTNLLSQRLRKHILPHRVEIVVNYCYYLLKVNEGPLEHEEYGPVVLFLPQYLTLIFGVRGGITHGRAHRSCVIGREDNK